jgi:hypothetical protein
VPLAQVTPVSISRYRLPYWPEYGSGGTIQAIVPV